MKQFVAHAVDDWASLARWKHEWERLAEVALEPAPAAEHWMLIPALRTLSAGERVRVVVVTRRQAGSDTSSETLCGVFPLLLRSTPGLGSTLVEIWFHQYAISAIPLVARTEASGCIGAFLGWLRREMPASTLLKVPEVMIGGAFHTCLRQVLASERLDFAVDSCWARAWFRPAGDAESYVAALGNAHHRKEWRRLERRLAERGALAYDELKPEGDVHAWLNEFMALENAGWKGRQGTAFRSNPDHMAWLQEVVVDAFARRRLMMLALRMDGVPIAMKLNILGGDGGYAFKIAYDERLEKFSPGVLLELENIRSLHQRRELAWMDSLAAPNHSLIERVWSGNAAFATVVIAPGRLAGRLILAARPLLGMVKRTAESAMHAEDKR